MQKKIDLLFKKFNTIETERQLYEEIIYFGSKRAPFQKIDLVKENLVQGCQSELYLSYSFHEGKIDFFVHSEALFTLGLASILAFVYSSETPKDIFLHAPNFLKELSILQKISMNRQVGILNLYKKMQLISSKYV
jgi:sulfur transfer protein SufE